MSASPRRPPTIWAAMKPGAESGRDTGEGVGEHPTDGEGGVGDYLDGSQGWTSSGLVSSEGWNNTTSAA